MAGLIDIESASCAKMATNELHLVTMKALLDTACTHNNSSKH